MKQMPAYHARAFSQQRAPWLVAAIIAAMFVLAAPLISHAQGAYPPPTDALYVNDYAGVINAEDAAHIHTLFSNLRCDKRAVNGNQTGEPVIAQGEKS